MLGVHVATVIDIQGGAGVDPVRPAISADQMEPERVDFVRQAHASGRLGQKLCRHGRPVHKQRGRVHALGLRMAPPIR